MKMPLATPPRPEQGRGQGMRRHRVLAQLYWMPIAVLVLGLVSTGLLLWAYRLNEREWLNFEHFDAIMDVRVRVTSFHLRFDEAMAQGRRDVIYELLPDVHAMAKLSYALLHGGESERGTPLPPLAPSLRGHAEVLAARIGEFQAIAATLYQDPEVGRIGSGLDQRLDAACDMVDEATKTLERLAQTSLAENHVTTRRLLFAAVLVWTPVVAASTVGFYSRERRRRRAELALEKAYDEMEQRVLARTAELAEANRHLKDEVAERTRTEAFLRQSEEKFRGLSLQFRTLLETMPDRITLISREFKVLWANRSAGVMEGPEAEPPREECCYTLYGPARCHPCPAVTSFSTGIAANARISTPDGRQWEMRTVPIVGDDGTVENVLEVATDVTERVRLQAETTRATHLASIGELAAGVAHEINSPINGIINYAQILCNKSDVWSAEHDIASRILKEGHRISDIVGGLLTFARRRPQERKPAHVEDILSESLALTRSRQASSDHPAPRADRPGRQGGGAVRPRAMRSHEEDAPLADARSPDREPSGFRAWDVVAVDVLKPAGRLGC